MSRAYIFNARLRDILRYSLHLFIGLVKEMHTSDITINLLVREGLSNLMDDIRGAAMRATVQDHKALVRIKNETLLMRKIIQLPRKQTRSLIHLLTLTDQLQIGRFMWDQPCAIRQLIIPRNILNAISEIPCHVLRQTYVLHKQAQLFITVLLGCFPQIKLRLLIIPEKPWHPIAMIIMRMAQNAIIHGRNVETKLFHILRKEFRRTRIQ